MSDPIISKFITGLFQFMEENTDGGTAISGSEKRSLEKNAPSLDPYFIDRVVKMANQRDEEIIFSQNDITQLNQEFPEESQRLWKEITSCNVPWVPHLFSAKAESLLPESSCQTTLEDISSWVTTNFGLKTDPEEIRQSLPYPDNFYLESLQNEISSDDFKQFVGQLKDTYPPENFTQYSFLDVLTIYRSTSLKEAVFESGFIQFATNLKNIYGIDVIAISKNPYAYSFFVPNTLNELNNKENQKLAQRVRVLLNLGPEDPITLEDLKIIKRFETYLPKAESNKEKIKNLIGPNFTFKLPTGGLFSSITELANLRTSFRVSLDEIIKKATTLYPDLKRVYKENFNINNLYDLQDFLHLVGEDYWTKKLFDKKIIKTAHLIEKNGFELNILDHQDREFLLDFTEKLQGTKKDLRVIKSFGLKPNVFTEFAYNTESWDELIKDLQDPKIAELIQLFSPDDSNELEFLLKTAKKNPNFDQLLGIAKSLKLNETYLELYPLTRFTEEVLDVLQVLNTNYPRIKIDLFTIKDDLIFSSQVEELGKKLSDEKTKKAYTNLIALIDKDEVIQLKEFIELSNDTHLLDKIANVQTWNKITEAINLLLPYTPKNLKITLAYINLSPENLDKVTSPKSREFLSILRDNYNFYSIPTYELEDYALLLDQDGVIEKTQSLARHGYFKTNIGLSSYDYRPDFLNNLYQGKLAFKLEDLFDENFLSFIAELNDDEILSILYPKNLESLISISSNLYALQIIKALSSLTESRVSDLDLPLLKIILLDEKVTQTILDIDFQSFCRFVSKNILFPGGCMPSDVYQLAVFYQDQKSKEKDPLAFVNSDQFKQTIDHIRKISPMMSVTSGMLALADQYGSQFDFEKITELANTLSIPPSVHDLPLLNQIAEDDSSKKLFKNTEELLAKAGIIYEKTAYPRLKRDQAPFGSFDEEAYTERPPLDGLDSLSLYKLVLLNQALENLKTQDTVSKIVATDIKDTGTERGGLLVLKNGSFQFEEAFSTSEDDGAYSNIVDKNFNSGVMGFHLHALSENNAEYSGPSGDPYAPGYGGDWGFAFATGQTQVLITTLGTEEDGKKIKINVDMFYYDSERKPICIDLGDYSIPYV